MKDDIFENYSRETEPAKYYKTYAWKTAIGLQQVDGLTPSQYLIKTAEQSINGDITFDDAQALIASYYKENKSQAERTEEADKVSVRIAQIISENSFTFSPVEFVTIHKRLFEGIYSHAGTIRSYNITKDEWVLDGDTVAYGNAISLQAALEYDIKTERNFNYKNLSATEVVAHIARFVSNLWQIHAFGEGNTRTVAVFLIKYLNKLGFNVTNDIFAENSWYFRNALVRANYSNVSKGVYETTEYLELFLRNLLLGENNALLNRELHINYKKSESPADSKTQIIDMIKSNPNVTLQEIADKIGRSLRTVKSIIQGLQEQGIVERVGGKKNGSWKINS